MAGRNLYDHVIRQFGSIAEARQRGFIKQAAPEGPSIFLSHIKTDKETVKGYAEFIKKQGIDYYLDVEDKDLQKAEQNGNHAKVTEFIEAGIRRCTDVMIFLSQYTRTSWWVPYEIGFGKCAEKKLVCVRLTDVKVDDLAFLKIARLLANRREFVGYIEEMRMGVRNFAYGAAGQKRAEVVVDLLLERRPDNPAPGLHPLDVYMNPE